MKNMDNQKYKIINDRKEVDKVWIGTSELMQKVRSDYKYSILNQIYLKEYNDQDYVNNSIVLLKDNKPSMIIPSFSKSSTLSYFDEPTRFINIFDNNESIYTAHKFTFEFLKSSISHIKDVLIDADSVSIKGFHNHLADWDKIFEGFVDLTLSEDVIYSSIRKSYKSLINWGRQTLRLEILNVKNPSYSGFMAFKNLHFASSGHKTRSDQTWDIQYQMIKNGQAFHINAFDERDELICGVFILHDSDKAFYGVSASNREIMKTGKPVGHWPLYQAILYAKNINCNVFNFGKIDKEQENGFYDKVDNILFFKSGFCTNIVPKISFYLNLKEMN